MVEVIKDRDHGHQAIITNVRDLHSRDQNDPGYYIFILFDFNWFMIESCKL